MAQDINIPVVPSAPGAAHNLAPVSNSARQPIPNTYFHMSEEELDERIQDARHTLGKRLTILGHHYQRSDIIKYADLRGDSYKLARFAEEQADAEYIIFCGVNFMGETADILSKPEQKVILPNLDAGCHMADMAPTQDAYDCWDDLTEVVSTDRVMPVTYMNSTADIKALVGKNGGIVSTSSNNDKIFQWAQERREKILFFPDQYLGANTWNKLNWDRTKVTKWNPYLELGGNTKEQLDNARLILWAGFCSVHKRFTLDQVKSARENHDGIKVIVHPECTEDVADASDYVGSTEYIIQMVTNAPSGTKWAIGTEINLVGRLQEENPDKLIFCLDPVVCPCSMMYRIHPAYLAWVIENLVEGTVVNQISVDQETAHFAKLGLDRMLQIS